MKFIYSDFKAAGEAFLSNLLQELKGLGIADTHLQPDHLCYRVESKAEYQQYKNFLLNHGELLTEAPVNGRAICTFKLKAPFVVGAVKVDLLELPAPKSGSAYVTGFEHAEFVIKEDFKIFAALYPTLSFHSGGNKLTNPELSLKTAKGQAKFHHASLDRVIEIEQAAITDIVLDFDGTIIESREAIYKINARVFSTILNREVTTDEAKAKYSPEYPKLLEYFEVTCPELAKKAVNLWGQFAEEMTFELFTGMADLLHKMHAQNLRLHIWTARDLASTLKTLKHHKIEHLFTTISAAHDETPKPHRESLNFPWKSAKPNSFVVIGDNPTDIIGAKNVAAIPAAALWDPHAKRHSLISAGAELYFHDVAEFETWILQKN
jgi:predicted metalloenzyme YecM/phosphoglycolate phosphatase-like HAD superfamily hydrolase